MHLSTRALSFVLPIMIAGLCAGLAPTAIACGGDYDVALEEAETLWERWEEGVKSGDLEKSYRLAAVSGSRILIAYPKGTSKSKLQKSSDKTVKAFDKLFPLKTREQGAPERRTAVIFALAGEKSFKSIVGHVGKEVPRLAGWAGAAYRGVGFLLEEPLVAGWLTAVPDSEVWNAENEEVNRLARLLLIERYGRLPQWLGQGLAWHIELSVCKDIYCFPSRSGFVSKKEHKAWKGRLSTLMKARGETPLDMELLNGWKRDSWDEERSALAWGAAAMLSKHYKKELPRVLSAYRELRFSEGRETAADGSWTLLPDYEISAAKELEILNRELDVDFLAQLSRFATKPNTYSRPR